ncbi:MAG: CDGSH iron-sulfur domain-containing protein [Acidimicrobiales bacterium]
MSDEAERLEARVQVTPNGPYVVAGGVPITRRRPVRSEYGEPLTWQTTTRLEAPARYALCRCGQSSNKPFCDGTHAKVGFDAAGTGAGLAENYDSRSKTYLGTGIVVRDDRSVCVHAGFCGNRITNVWKLVSGSGTDDSIVRAQVMAMIERCPSGALTYRVEADGADIEPELADEIGVIDDGPLWVTGRVVVTGPDGEEIEWRNRMTLCRCGQSKNKPLCDGSHTEAGFLDH